ncbi:hypothetical protein KFK09_007662 [Dendrobium nobile]|uniref:Uncharacterized protein n=1 Tax=Dendrobium nobile TaxID=94219 RepID=A0A8T3BX57_DENNO|nr:hypothetical protein KFK09_007662 [Dendrobium nobile]
MQPSALSWFEEVAILAGRMFYLRRIAIAAFSTSSRIEGFAFRLLFSSLLQIARVTASAPSLLFDFCPSTTFPSCRIGSYDILIGSNGSSLAEGNSLSFSLSRASSAKFRKSAELEDLVNPGFTAKRGKRRVYSAVRRSNPVWQDLA